MQKLFERVKQIISNPTEAITSIKTEDTTIEKLYFEFLIFIAVIPLIATFLGWIGGSGSPVIGSLIRSIIFTLIILFFIWLTSFVSNLFGSNVGVEKNILPWFKISTLAWTPYMVSTIVHILPRLSFITLAAIIYGVVIFAKGCEELIGIPKQKRVPSIIVYLIVMILLWSICFSIHKAGT